MQYHVFLQGKQLGPYDQRTIVGMRIKKTLSNGDVLIDQYGGQTTVGQLLGKTSKNEGAGLDLGNSVFDTLQTGAYSPVVGLFMARHMHRSKGLVEVPAFVGGVQARAHTDLLRLAGVRRTLFKRKEGRVKIPFGQILRVQQQGAQLALWVRTDTRQTGAPSITLEMHSADDAKALLAALPDSTGREIPDPAAASTPNRQPKPAAMQAWWPVVGMVGLVGLVLAIFVVIMIFRR